MLQQILDGGAAVGNDSYTPLNTVHTERFNPDGTMTPIVNLTALSDLYGVQYTFTITEATWQAGGAPAAFAQRTEWVNAICAHEHVIDFYTEADQGPSQIMYNFAVIHVGTDDGALDGVVRIRMDQLNSPGAFAAIDREWNLITALGTPGVV